MTPGSNQNFRVPVSAVLLPLHPAVNQEVRLCSLEAKGKLLHGQARYRGLQRLRQPLHLLLGAFEQMNVNSRSNVTRRMQTIMWN